MNGSGHTCRHCSITFRWAPIVENDQGDDQPVFCCRGCQGAYRLICQAGLASFYDRGERATPTLLVSPAASFNDEDLARFVVPDGDSCRIDILIGGISCPSCIWLLERMIARCDGVQEVSISYAGGVASVRFDGTRLQPSAIFSTIATLGYVPRPYSHALSQEYSRREKNDLLIRFGTALFLVMQLMAYSYSLYAGYFQGMAPAMKNFLQYVSLLVATPVVFYCGWPFLSGALKSVIARRPGMDLLIAIGALSAWFYSVWGTFARQETYFESAAMIITFVLAGRLLELMVKQHAMSGIESLYAAVPQRAIRVNNGQQSEVGVDDLKPGDLLVIRQGDKFPVDCLIVSGSTEVDQALVTGESVPVLVVPGDEVRAGSVNSSSPVEAQALRPVGQSYLMRVAALVQMAQAGKPSLQRLADRVAGWFVPAVLLLALMVLAFQLASGQTLLAGIMRALAVVLIACPCAVGLAVPTAVLAACSRAAVLGIIVRGGDVLERLATIRHTCFDKTGTITLGTPVVVETALFELFSITEVLRCTASLEQKSAHPVALSLLKHAAEQGILPGECRDVRIFPGRGIAGQLEDGRGVLCGSRQFLFEQGLTFAMIAPAPDQSGSSVWVALDGALAACFVLRDRLRPGARRLVESFQSHGIAVHLLSGDTQQVVDQIAVSTAIQHGVGGMLPDQKLDFIKQLQVEKNGVLMVGDGVNDAPSLAAADVSCTLTGSSDIALENSDIIITGDDLSRLATAHLIARRTMTIIKQNLAWACLYNLIGIPLAMTGFLTPIYASIAMVVSSLLVSLNSLRLMRIKHHG